MATIKRRLNISLSPEMDEAIKILAKKDSVPEATKAAEMLRLALELDEDAYLYNLADGRDSKNTKYIKGDEFWEELK